MRLENSGYTFVDRADLENGQFVMIRQTNAEYARIMNPLQIEISCKKVEKHKFKVVFVPCHNLLADPKKG